MLEDVPKEGSPLKINGSVMMAVASSKEEVLEKIKKDVYADKGVWDMDKVSDLDDREWNDGLGDGANVVNVDSDFPFQVGY